MGRRNGGGPAPTQMRSGDSRKALIRRVLTTSSAGFAAVDALVALTVLASTLVLALGAVSSAQRAAAAALETRHAQQLLGSLMNLPKASPGVWQGNDQGLAWTLSLTSTIDPSLRGSWPVCRRIAEARSKRTARRYELSTVETCSLAGEA